MKDHRKTIQTLFISNAILMFGFQVWRTVFNNLAVEDLGLEAGAVGAIQSMREIPGLVGFLFVLAVTLLGSEMRVMRANVVLLGVGLILTGVVQNLTLLIVGTLVTSIGFHFFTSGSAAVLLQVTTPVKAPRELGRLNSVGALASVLATLGIFAAALVLSNRSILTLSGFLVILAGLALWPRMNIAQSHEHQHKPARESVRREYWLYYVLTFLMGARRHIFSTFAIFLLVRVHGMTTWQTALLFLVNGVVSFLALPQLGRLVGHFGEQRVLVLNFFCILLIFLGYATIDQPLILVLLFTLDNLFCGFMLALNSYFQKIAVAPQDITPNMSLGQSINHVAAVIIPVTGGLMWEAFDPAMPFLVGAFIALLSMPLTYWLRVPRSEVAWCSAD